MKSLWYCAYYVIIKERCLQMKESILHEKTLEFAAKIVKLYEEFLLLKKDNTIVKQLVRSATSIGANLNEATYGNSKADFIAKLHISLKECSETLYWLKLIDKVGYAVKNIDILIKDCDEIKAMLIKSINTAKSNS